MNSFFFPHDNQARNDQKIVILRVNHGLEGYAIFFMLVEEMESDSTGFLSRDFIAALAPGYMTTKDKILAVLDYCVQLKLFKKCDHENYYSDRVLNHKKEWSKYSEYGRIGGLKRVENQKLSNPPLRPPIQPPSSIKNIKNINKEDKEKNKERMHHFPDSPYFDKKVFKKALPDWPNERLALYYDRALGYSQANGGKYLDWLRAVKNWYRDDCLKNNPQPKAEEKRGLEM